MLSERELDIVVQALMRDAHRIRKTRSKRWSPSAKAIAAADRLRIMEKLTKEYSEAAKQVQATTSTSEGME